MTEKLSMDEVYRIYKSQKSGKPIAYTSYGKVILITNKVHCGYGKVTSYVDKGNYFFAKMENVPYDFYHGYDNDETIPYDEFQQVLTMHGYTHQYTESINDNNNFYVWANIKTGSIITIEEWNYDDERTYNSVEMYVVTDEVYRFANAKTSGFSFGNPYISCYNLVFSELENPMKFVESLWKGSKDWKGKTPNLWHYGYKRNTTGSIDFIKAIKTIYKFKDSREIIESFNIDVEGHIKKLEEFYKC